MKKLLCVFAAGACFIFSHAAFAADSPPKTLIVFAAASLTNVIQELGDAYAATNGISVKSSFAASSVLARQIENGAPADLFFSADHEWMDYLQTRNLIKNASRTDLVGNRLVLIAPADSALILKIVPNFALAAALGSNGRLATGDPDSVPVGRYAKYALTTLHVWDSIVDRLIRADSVRTALAFVDRGEAPLGIVYETDAMIDKKVRIVDRFPEDTHPPINYPAALIRIAKPEAQAFLDFLHSSAAQASFQKYGFIALPAASGR
jgi:molybdate transport system substrate-binding protein